MNEPTDQPILVLDEDLSARAYALVQASSNDPKATLLPWGDAVKQAFEARNAEQAAPKKKSPKTNPETAAN